MELSNQNKAKKLFCLARREWVTETPEELVRQKLVEQMIKEWGYPHSLLRLEVALSSLLPLSLKKEHIPRRRLDVVAFTKNTSGVLVPLLIVECKENPKDLTLRTFQQLLGYNYYLGASFAGLVASGVELEVYCARTHEKLVVPPTYQELIYTRSQKK